MKTVKIKFAGFWPDFTPEKFGIYQLLQKHYDVVITDDADYVICSIFDYHPYVEDPQVRILFSGENYIPDFNLVDYAVSVYPLDFLDRHFSLPGMVDWLDHYYELQNKDRDYPDTIMREKPLFANFIASHDSDNGVRGELFEMLSRYKRIESPGKFLYNMPNGEMVSRDDGTKRALQRKCKFTLCSESTCEAGFITEKMFEAFCADTIPVYLGSSTVTDVFNKDAFINIADFGSLQEVVDRIIELDSDDEKFLRMLRQPVFVQQKYAEQKLAALENFLCHIFDQPLEKAYRRPRVYMPKEYERMVRLGRQAHIDEIKKARRKEKSILHKAKIAVHYGGIKLLRRKKFDNIRRWLKREK